MKSKISGIFTKNIPLKIVALFAATITWLLVVNINNPTQTRTFTTNVEIINGKVLTDQGKFYDIPGGQNTVTFRVTAPRSVIEKLSSDDFVAVADMKNLEDDYRIPVQITARNNPGNLNISSKQYYINVEVGNEVTDKFMISATTQGEPAAGFVVDSVVVSPNVINVSGPEAIVSTISKVVVNVEVGGMSGRISENLVPQLYDSGGNKVDSTRLNLSLQVVNVDVSFLNAKEVSLELENTGIENEFARVTEILIEPEVINIKGESAILNNIKEIIIPSTVVDLATITENISTTVDITQYLPEGVSLHNTPPQVRISVIVALEVSTTLTMPFENVEITGLAEGLSARITDEELLVEVLSAPALVDELYGEDIKGTLDLTGFSEGEYSVRLVMSENENFVAKNINVTVKIEAEGN